MSGLRSRERVNIDAALYYGTGITADDVRALIREEAEYEGGVRALARLWEVSAPYVSDLIHGRRAPGPAILARLGLRREVTVRYYHDGGSRGGRDG